MKPLSQASASSSEVKSRVGTEGLFRLIKKLAINRVTGDDIILIDNPG